MTPQFVYNGTQDYITHITLEGERIIPSDSFDIGDNEYLLLEIMKSTDNIIFLRIIGIKGSDLGSIYTIPQQEFTENTLAEIQKSLQDYKH